MSEHRQCPYCTHKWYNLHNRAKMTYCPMCGKTTEGILISGNAHKTAITRTKLSAPAAWLQGVGRLKGRVLDYGCGRGGDADRIGCEGYGPHYRPGQPVGPFDTIMCNFVLNVIESESERCEAVARIADLLSDSGCAYIAVRTDKAALSGTKASGSWQGLIAMDLPVVHRGSGYRTYVLRKFDSGCAIFSEVF